MIPVVTILGLQFGSLLGGSVVVESVFGMPGIGLLILNAIGMRDYPIVQGAVIFTAVMFMLTNLLVDVLYGYLDPRIRLSRSGRGALMATQAVDVRYRRTGPRPAPPAPLAPAARQEPAGARRPGAGGLLPDVAILASSSRRPTRSR